MTRLSNGGRGQANWIAPLPYLDNYKRREVSCGEWKGWKEMRCWLMMSFEVELLLEKVMIVLIEECPTRARSLQTW